MKVKSSFISILGAMAFALACHGSVTITDGAIGIINDSLGSMVSLGSIGILVAATDGNSLVDPYGTTLTVGNTLGGTGADVILGVYHAVNLNPSGPSANPSQNGFDLSGTTFNLGTVKQNDLLYMVWFPSISTVGATVGSGVSYGAFRTNNIDASGNMAWIVPSDGNYGLYSLDSSLGGNPAVSAGALNATHVTAVPEPSTYGLVGVAAIILAFFRARKRHCS